MSIQTPTSLERSAYQGFKYRIYPTKQQEHQLRQFAGCSRFIYNWGLNRWAELYKLGHKPTVFGLSSELTLLKQQPEYSWLNDCVAQVLQQSLSDLGVAFTNFFQKRSSYPKFHKKGHNDSFRVPQYFQVIEDAKRIRLPKIGFVKYDAHRPLLGIPKSVTVSRRGSQWFVSVLCEVQTQEIINPNVTVIGVDLGVVHLATTYDGEHHQFFDHNRKLDQAYHRLTTLQQRLSRSQKGSKNKSKRRIAVANQHLKITNMRLDTLHKLSTTLCKNHARVVFEDLAVENMIKSAKGTIEQPGKNVSAKRGLNRSISRQGWGILFQQCLYKAVRHDSSVVIVNAAYTSQDCPVCGHRSAANRKSQANFSCQHCGYTFNADKVASVNIRSRGL